MTYRERLYEHYQSAFKHGFEGRVVSSKKARDSLRPFCEWLPADLGVAILDVGCGSGDLLLALRDAGYRNISGVDVGPEQVSMAQGRGLCVELRDGCDYLSEHQGTYHTIIACDILEHLTRDEAFSFLEALRRALVEGGQVLLRLPNGAAPRGAVYQLGDLTHETAYCPNSLRQLGENVGAKSILIREETLPWNSPVRMARWILWKALRQCYRFADLIETGSTVETYTRNMVVRLSF
jgi:2-polyprenyl-3-methyl-5-hydroxy-6-metoxy-1,4-benzoquinol methylase